MNQANALLPSFWESSAIVPSDTKTPRKRLLPILRYAEGMAQDPEPGELEESRDQIDPSHDLDMIPLYESMTIEAEMEAAVLSSLLESNGIPALVVGSPIPSVGFQVQVPRVRLEEARHLVEEAKLEGPQAAAEAEQATEPQ
jgi:hypothetical protein